MFDFSAPVQTTVDGVKDAAVAAPATPWRFGGSGLPNDAQTWRQFSYDAPQGLEDDRQRALILGKAAQQRFAPVASGLNTSAAQVGDAAGMYQQTGINTGRADDAWAQQNGIRAGDQSQALGLLGSAAMGNQPSVAQQQMMAGNQAAERANLGMANSARGGAGNQVAAMRQAMETNAGMNQQNNQQMGMLRAQEMENARGQYMGGATNMRGQDIGAQGAAFGQGLQTGQFADDQNKFRTKMRYDQGTFNAGQDNAMGIANLNARLGQTGLNDAQTGRYLNDAQATRASQLHAADQAQAGSEAHAALATNYKLGQDTLDKRQQEINNTHAKASADRVDAYVDKGLKIAGSMFTMGAM